MPAVARRVLGDRGVDRPVADGLEDRRACVVPMNQMRLRGVRCAPVRTEAAAIVDCSPW
jgi:hypothetical protein